MSPTLIILAVLVAAAIYIVFVYNDLVQSKVRVKEASSDIDVQLKRR